MASDSTYRFFKREFDFQGNGPSFAPVIKTSRVIASGRVRGSSVPPIHLGVSRASIAGPSRGSVAVPRTIHTVSNTSLTPRSRASLSAAAGSVAPLSGYHPRPVLRRASIAAPGGSSVTFWRASSTVPAAPGRGGLSEVTKTFVATKPLYRPSSQAGYGRSAAVVKPSLAGRSGARTQATGFGPLTRTSSAVTLVARPQHRKGLVSTFDLDNLAADEGLVPRGPTIPLARYGPRGRAATKTTTKATSDDVWVRQPPTPDNFKVTLGAKHLAPGQKLPAKVIDNDVKVKKKLDVESQMEQLVPVHEDSLAKLRARAQQARDQLSRHRVLLDRYLPIQLGPDNDVNYEVETRYGELLSRMPHWEQREKSRKNKDDFQTVIPPYKPAEPTPKGQKLLVEIANIPVKNSFTPKISDTRKRARSVLCKVKGDPKYFDF